MRDALNALCIVDQIHTFAMTTHRSFVTKHLEPWIQLAEEELSSFCDEDDGFPSDDEASSSFRLNVLNSGYDTSSSVPLWKELETSARLALSNKRSETRKLNGKGKQPQSENTPHIADREGVSMEIDEESLGNIAEDYQSSSPSCSSTMFPVKQGGSSGSFDTRISPKKAKQRLKKLQE